MDFKELVSPSLTDLFVSQLTEKILSNELKIGDKLPSERELARQMNVSLAVVNAGITRLAFNGLLEVVPRKGVVVADYIRNGNINTVKAILDFSGGLMDEPLLNTLTAFRQSVELTADQAACRNRSEDDLARLRSCLEQFGRADSDEKRIEAAFAFFHDAAAASGNPYYPMLIMTFKPLYQAFYRQFLKYRGSAALQDLLEQLYDGIRNRQEASVGRLVNDHLTAWRSEQLDPASLTILRA